MRLALAQFNPIVGDIAGNANEIARLADADTGGIAVEKGAENEDDDYREVHHPRRPDQVEAIGHRRENRIEAGRDRRGFARNGDHQPHYSRV